MLQGKGTERCTWYGAGNLEGIDRQEDADVAIHVVEAFQRANTRVKGDRTYHLIISLHPDDRSLSERELEMVVRRAVHAAGFGEHQYIAVRHSDQEHAFTLRSIRFTRRRGRSITLGGTSRRSKRWRASSSSS